MNINHIEVHVASAFAHPAGWGGNLAGVVTDASQLTEAEKQAVAKAAGFSETAFIDAINGHDVHMSFYTPNKRVPDCGHATVAAFHVLKLLGLISLGEFTKVLAIGKRAIEVTEHQVYLQGANPSFSTMSKEVSRTAMRSLGLNPELPQLIEPAVCASIGSAFLLLEVPDIATLEALKPNRKAVFEVSEQIDVVGFYAYAQQPGHDFDIATRMFAPRYGIDEESATGMAAGALGAWRHAQNGAIDFQVAQGDWMKPQSPSRLHVQVRAYTNNTADIWVGGAATTKKD